MESEGTAEVRSQKEGRTLRAEVAGSHRRVALSANGVYFPRMNSPKIAQRTPIVQKAECGTYWWCTCGESNKQPFCDGSHKGKGFAPMKVEVTEGKTVAWCGCKHTGNKPFCDGSHSKIA